MAATAASYNPGAGEPVPVNLSPTKSCSDVKSRIKLLEIDEITGPDVNEDQVKEILRKNYNKIINFMISDVTGQELDTCSQELSFIKAFHLNNKNEISTESSETRKVLTGPIIFKDEFNEILLKNKIILNDPALIKKYDTMFEFNKASLTVMKDEFNFRCKNIQYFVPLSIYEAYNPIGHRNLLIFNKEEKVVTWIEPNYSEDITPQKIKDITAIIKFLIGEFIDTLVYEYSIDMPSKVCPQTIAYDRNCTFWTLLLTVTLILNKNSTIDEVSSAILTCYDTKEKLGEFMVKFKKFIIELATDHNLIQSAGKRKKTKKSKSKNRKTRRNTKPKKRVYLQM
jgi:hypothetical protein